MSETRVSRNPRSSKTLRAARRISLRRSRPLEVSGPASRRSRWDAEAPATTRPAGLPPRGLMAPPVSVPGRQLALEYLATGERGQHDLHVAVRVQREHGQPVTALDAFGAQRGDEPVDPCVGL